MTLRPTPTGRRRLAPMLFWMSEDTVNEASLKRAEYTDPTFGAPSCSTTSAFQSFRVERMCVRHCGVVMSAAKVVTRGIGFIGTRSMPWGECFSIEKGSAEKIHVPTIILLGGMYLLATWSQPPGAAHKSMQHLADSRKLYFLLSWISLNAERAR